MGSASSSKVELSNFSGCPKGRTARIDIPGSEMEYCWLVISVKRKYLILCFKTCGLASELVCNMGILSGGYLSGPFLGIQIALAIVTFVFGIVDSVLAYWNCKIQVELDPVTAMV